MMRPADRSALDAYATPAENMVIAAGARVVYWNPVVRAFQCATMVNATTLYPLREQAAPADPHCTYFIDADTRNQFAAGRLYPLTDAGYTTVAVLAYVPIDALSKRGKGRTAGPKLEAITTAGTRDDEPHARKLNDTDAPHADAVDEITPDDISPRMPSPRPTASTPASAVAPSTAEALAALLASLTPAGASDADAHARIDALSGTVAELTTKVATISAPLRIEVTHAANPEAPAKSLGVQHHAFPTLMRVVQTRLPNGRRIMPWLVGPAGTGKTKAASGVADALGVPLALIGTMTDAFQVLGYMDARGAYVSTPFRQAWEFGGVILLDESDRADAHATVALLGGLDSGTMQFPDARVPMHADCIIIAAGNTSGTGATAQFRAAKAQDSAYADRFVFLDWPHDDALESALSTHAEWLRYVRAVRQEVRARKLPEQGFDVTTRATLDGQSLLAAGVDVSTVVDMAVRRRMPATTWNEIASAVPCRVSGSAK